jgi:flagellar basal body P-ring formation protein FlgA
MMQPASIFNIRVLLLVPALFLLGQLLPGPALPAPAAAPAGQVLSEAAVKRVIGDYLVQRAAPLKAQVSIKRIGYSGEMRLPEGQVTYEVVAPERWEGYGSASVALIVRVDDQVKRNLTVMVEVEALADMVVAARTLERGEVLVASDLALAKKDLAHVQGRFLSNIDDAVGLRVKTTLRANSPVRGDYLERVPVVKSGQMVTMVAENEVVRITATGRAKGSGAVGDLITVQNVLSLKDVPARVVDAATVKVDF